MNKINDRLRYQANALSFWLALLGLAANCFYMVGVYRSTSVVPDIYIGSDIVINIIFMLLVFLGAEQMKVYHRTWSYIMFGIGVCNLFRIFYIPVHFYEVGVTAAGLMTDPVLASTYLEKVTSEFTLSIIYLCISAALLMSAAIIAFQKELRLRAILVEAKKRGENW